MRLVEGFVHETIFPFARQRSDLRVPESEFLNLELERDDGV